nr:TPM domain-containing protein [Sphingomonas alba]
MLLAACGSPAAAWQAKEGGVGAVAADVVLTGHVVDDADFLSPAAEERITDRLDALEQATTDQVVVVTLETLHGASIEDVAHDLGNRWGLGREGVDNGVLLIVARDEGSIRLTAGTGLESILTDERTQAIVNEMGPKFDQNLPVDAIETAVTEIDRLLRSNPKRPIRAGKKAS